MAARSWSYRAGALWGRLPMWARLTFGVSCAALAWWAWQGSGTGPAPPAPHVVAAPPAPPRAPQPADPRDVRRGQAALAVKWLRNTMHDPASFTLEDARFMADDSACYTYRAKNGFGALRAGRAVLTPANRLITADADKKAFTDAWDRHCAGPGGESLTAYVNRFVL